MKTPEQFMEYFRTNYPGPNTIIARPDWHAPKIYRAAIAASAHDDLLEAGKALEAAELQWANCPECSEATSFPELCGTCMPLFDDARLKRRAAIEKAEAQS